MPHGPWLKDGEWETLLTQYASFFDGIAEVLDYVIDPARGRSRP